jgi:HK97 family phage major capsid protein
MFSRLTPGSVSRAIWVAHPSCIPDLSTLSIAVGTGGSAIPVMTSADGSFTIMTRPVVFTEKMKTLGNRADIALCDFTHYAVGLRRDASLDRSQHVGFLNDLQTYRLQIRIDGQPTISAPIQPLNGATLSPFVVLNA